jgi:hypothetical protein
MIESCLLILLFLLLFFQVESYVDCYFPLVLFIFRFCWFTELIMLNTFLVLMGSAIFILSFILSWPHVLWFSFSSVWNIPLSIFYNTGPINMNCFSISLSWKVLISPLRSKGSFAGIVFLVGCYFLSELDLFFSMYSWILGFVLSDVRWF